jgi:hypothetical protein
MNLIDLTVSDRFHVLYGRASTELGTHLSASSSEGMTAWLRSGNTLRSWRVNMYSANFTQSLIKAGLLVETLTEETRWQDQSSASTLPALS